MRNASGWGDTEHSWAASRHSAHSEGAVELLERTKHHDTGYLPLHWSRGCSPARGPGRGWLAPGHVMRCWAVIGPVASTTHWSVRREERWAGRRCLARAGTLGAGECGVKRKTLNLFSGVQESSNIDISRFRILCLSIKTSIWLPFSRFWFWPTNTKYFQLYWNKYNTALTIINASVSNKCIHDI